MMHKTPILSPNCHNHNQFSLTRKAPYLIDNAEPVRHSLLEMCTNSSVSSMNQVENGLHRWLILVMCMEPLTQTQLKLKDPDNAFSIRATVDGRPFANRPQLFITSFHRTFKFSTLPPLLILLFTQETPNTNPITSLYRSLSFKTPLNVQFDLHVPLYGDFALTLTLLYIQTPLFTSCLPRFTLQPPDCAIFVVQPTLNTKLPSFIVRPLESGAPTKILIAIQPPDDAIVCLKKPLLHLQINS